MSDRLVIAACPAAAHTLGPAPNLRPQIISLQSEAAAFADHLARIISRADRADQARADLAAFTAKTARMEFSDFDALILEARELCKRWAIP